MKKEKSNAVRPRGHALGRLVAYFFCLFLGTMALPLQAQDQNMPRVSLDVKNETLIRVIENLREQTRYNFMFNSEELRGITGITLRLEKVSLRVALDKLLKEGNRGLTYTIEGKTVVIRKQTQTPSKPVIIRGKVQDVKKHPLPGVTVIVKGTTIGVTTNANGEFSLSVPSAETSELMFSFVGMKSVTLKCANRPKQGDWIITMEDDVLEMDEVNVVSTGYGDIDRRRLTSAVTSLKMDDIRVAGLTSVDQMLEGHVPGMIFMQNSGQLGATPRVRIRGNSTIVGNREPLWVVDGIVQTDPVNVDPSQLNDLDFVNLLGNAISGLNPDDIERIDVLKDAAATAIYGTRAANGVIVITTKKGKPGPPSFTYSFDGTFSRRPRYSDKTINMMNSKERVEVSREMFSRQLGFENVRVFTGYDKAAMDYYEGRIGIDEFRRLADYYETMNTDWFDLLCQNTFSHKHTLSLSGGSQNVRYYASVGFNNQQGTSKKEQNRLFSSIVKVNGTFDKLTFQFSSNFNTSKKRYTPNVDGMSVTQYAYQTSRAIPAYNPDGTLAYHQIGETGNSSHVVLSMINEMETTYQRIDGHTISMNGMVGYRFWDVLTVEGTASYTASSTTDESVFEEDSYYVLKLRDPYNNECPVGGERQLSTTRMNSWMLRLQLNYGQLFGKHMVNASLGGEISSSKHLGEKIVQRGYFPDRGKSFGAVPESELTDNYSYRNWLRYNLPTLTETQTNLASLYLSLTYNYADKYILNFNTRMDGSNQFGSRSREKLLPIWSMSGRWDVAKEFWPDHPNVNELALKLSYGHQGNMINGQTTRMIIQKQAPSAYFEEYRSTVQAYANPGLKWETTRSYNAELVFSLLKNKISGSFSYFYKKTTDAFLTKKISSINGRAEYTVNSGNLENQGVEVALSFMPINRQVTASGKRGFVWRFDPQIGQVLNKLINKALETKENTVRDVVTYQDFLDGTVEISGEPLNTFYSYRFKGLTSDKGMPMYYGTEMEREEELVEKYNKMTNEEVCLEVMEKSGTREPILQGGVSNYFGYRQFGLSLNFAYSLGNKVRMLKMCEEYNIKPITYRNMRKEFVHRWRRSGDETMTNIPGLVTSQQDLLDACWWGNSLYVQRLFAGRSDNYYTMYDYSNIRVVNGNYLKLQSMSFRYNLEDRFCQKLGIRSAYLSLSGTNLFIIQSKEAKGMDVSTQSGSAPTVSQSVRPTYSLSLNITF